MTSIEKLKTEFIHYCHYEKNLSPKTLKAYEIDIRQFVSFLTENKASKEIESIDKNIVRQYLHSISALKPKTVKRKIATIKALFNYLEYEDKIIVNPFRKMRIQIREPKVLPNVMNIHEVEKIISSSYQAKNNQSNTDSYAFAETIRDIAVIELLFATGIRVSELSHLRNDCINLHTGKISVKGKGNKERIIQVCNEEAMLALNEYYSLFKNKIKGNGYFFINRFNDRLSEQSVRFLVKKYAQSSGIQRRITPHSFRHSFATLLLEENVDIKYIQHLLVHSSIMTTQIYTHVNTEKQKQILQRHPRKNFHVRA